MARSRQSRKQAYLLGSRAEQKIRYLLREALIALDIKWDVAIGANLQHIHERFEIDIPVVLIERGTGRACRIAIEVDSAYTHSSVVVRDRDARKDCSLEKAGWQVVRVDGDCLRKKSALAEAVADLALSIERIAEEIFADRFFPEGRS
jgi:very-short-patch-repair endonuclease